MHMLMYMLIQESTGTLTPANPLQTFYADVSEPPASQAVTALLPQSMTSFTSPYLPPAWADQAYAGRCAYVHCSKDNALPPAIQHMMLKLSGVEWMVEHMSTSHSPFLSCPADLTRFIIVAAVMYAEKS